MSECNHEHLSINNHIGCPKSACVKCGKPWTDQDRKGELARYRGRNRKTHFNYNLSGRHTPKNPEPANSTAVVGRSVGIHDMSLFKPPHECKHKYYRFQINEKTFQPSLKCKLCGDIQTVETMSKMESHLLMGIRMSHQCNWVLSDTQPYDMNHKIIECTSCKKRKQFSKTMPNGTHH